MRCSTLFAGAALLLACTQVNAYSFDSNGRPQLSDAEVNTMLNKEDAAKLRKAFAEAARQLDEENKHMRRRSSSTGGYGPGNVQCPDMPKGNNYVGFIRNASDSKMSPQEAGYMSRHKEKSMGAWNDWLTRAQITGQGGIQGNVQDFLNDNRPTVAFAISGGGYRAMLDGMAMVQGFDGRNQTAKDRGVGGLLQAADYVAGLSGGSWATGSMAINNWVTPQSMVTGFMNLEENLIFPTDHMVSFYLDLLHDVQAKKKAGFDTAVVDLWGRALSYHLLNGTMYKDEGQATTFDDITRTETFQNSEYPFPIALAIGRQPGETWVNRNASYFEWTPYEFGSWKHGIKAFFPTGLVGSPMNQGKPAAEDKHCVSGFDNFGFVVGSSSTLFNAGYLKLLQDNSSSGIVDIAQSIMSDLNQEENDVAPVPNPFTGYGAGKNPFDVEGNIFLVDGGEANQNIPLEPFLQPARNVDMIVAMDGSADTGNSWPNGSSLYETMERLRLPEFKDIAFPRIPDLRTMVNQGLNTRPTFFGCNGTNDIINRKTATNPLPPLIVYLASYPYSAYTNTSTFQLGYHEVDQQAMLDNGFNVATMGGEMADWHQCLACASILRPLQKKNQPIPQKCQACFQKYCYNGERNDTVPGNYTPAVGDQPFIKSNGSDLVEPTVTGPHDGDDGGFLKNMLGDGDKNTTGGFDAKNGSVASARTNVFVLSLAVFVSTFVVLAAHL